MTNHKKVILANKLGLMPTRTIKTKLESYVVNNVRAKQLLGDLPERFMSNEDKERDLFELVDVIHDDVREKAYRDIVENNDITPSPSQSSVNSNSASISETNKSKLAFIVMPFNEGWSEGVCGLIKEVINEDVKELKLKAKRADDFFKPGVIMDDVSKCIETSAVIIADISALNCNVYYELGMAHALGRKHNVILLKQKNSGDIPFDLNSYRRVEYVGTIGSNNEFKQSLRQALLAVFDKD